ncbi:MAG: MobA/MobL family protein [Pseudomonadota bacterium]|nr:MobA/MobL family protein [Pseudomonadota bacterium]
MPPGSPAWAEDRAALWNAAEAAEKRKDARVARDYEVAIPKELTKEQGIALVRDFAAGLVDRYGVAVDFNVHRDDMRKWDGTEKGWQGYHAHVLTSTRKLGREGFGEKAEIELSDTKRKSLGLSDGAAEIERIREMWEVAANRHLEQANQAQRIDRRSLKDQGIDRDPTVHLGPGVTGLERDGIPSRLGDINRKVVAEHQAQIEDRRIVAALSVEIGEIYSEVVERGGGRPSIRRERDPSESALYRPDRLDPHERAAIRAAMWALVRERDLRIQRVLARAQMRQERRDKAYQVIAKAEPSVPKGLLDAFQKKGHEQALLAWEAAKEAAARLLGQAKRLAARLVEAVKPERLAAWALDRFKREQPEVFARHGDLLGADWEASSRAQDPERRQAQRARGKESEVERLSRPATSAEPPAPGVAPPKRDWNRYKALQQDLAKKGRESLQQRGVLPSDRDPPERDRDPPERKRDRGRSR